MKIVWTLIWGTIVLLMVALVVGRRLARNTGSAREAGEIGAAHVVTKQNDLSPLFTVPDFELTNQDNQPVTAKSLRGKVWIAQFIFTRCQGPCPVMLGKMRLLQDNLKSDSLRFISFSVDPSYDKPEILKERAKELGADTSRWNFLTGDEKHIQDTARGMLANAVPAANQPHTILHSEKFILIDSDGQCRGVYSSDDPQAVKNLMNDTETLVKAVEGKTK